MQSEYINRRGDCYYVFQGKTKSGKPKYYTTPDQRTYIAERSCYRGGDERWIWIGGPAPLENLAAKLVPHLGRESSYELV